MLLLRVPRFLLATVLFVAGLASAQVAQELTPFSADMQFGSSRANDAAAGAKGKVYVSGDQMRMDTGTAQGGSITIMNLRTQMVDILIPAQHIYLEHQIVEVRSRRPPGWADVRPLRDPSNPCAGESRTTCKKLGVEEVNGRTCDHWEITDKNGRVSNVWVDPKIQFPVKTVSYNAVWELSNIHEGHLDPALFEVPSDYHRMGPGAMPQGPPPGR